MSDSLTDERLAEIEAGIDGVGGLVNIYRAITGKDCERYIALGMATAAVSDILSALRAAREEAARLTKEVAEQREYLIEAQSSRDRWKDDAERHLSSLAMVKANLAEKNDEIKRLTNEDHERGTCTWESDDDGIWHTSCDNAFVFDVDGPVANGTKFCCYCGKLLCEVARKETQC